MFLFTKWSGIQSTGSGKKITTDEVTPENANNDESNMASSSSHAEDDIARTNHMLLMAGYACGTYYMENYLVKEPCWTSALTGSMCVQELEEVNPVRIYELFRKHIDVCF